MCRADHEGMIPESDWGVKENRCLNLPLNPHPLINQRSKSAAPGALFSAGCKYSPTFVFAGCKYSPTFIFAGCKYSPHPALATMRPRSVNSRQVDWAGRATVRLTPVYCVFPRTFLCRCS